MSVKSELWFTCFVHVLRVYPFFFPYRTHNGKEIIPDGHNIKVVSQPDGTVCLIIDKVKPQDAGEYAVTASNEKGDVTSKGKLEVSGEILLSSH